ncbi:MAG: hypothetical protein ACLQVL_20465 [Terriglobia bacterium]
MSDITSLPIDRMSGIGTTLQPESAKVSLKRDSPKRKQREPEQEGSEDTEEGGRLLDVEV